MWRLRRAGGSPKVDICFSPSGHTPRLAPLVCLWQLSLITVAAKLEPIATIAKVITHCLGRNLQPPQIETTCSNRLNIFKIPLNLLNKLKHAS